MKATVALTRAADDAARSAARLLALGYASVIAPATRVVATRAEIPRGDHDAAVATSARAFDALSETSREAILALPLFVVGAQTARAAAALGLAVEASAPDAAALEAVLRARLARGASLLYLAGRDRKRDLELALAAGGHRVTAIELYAAEARPAWTPEEARALSGCDAALHYSSRSVELALRLADRAGIGETFRALHHVCISEDGASRLRASGAARVRSARRPDEDALLAALARALRLA